MPIRNWLALVKYDERHLEDGVVLYSAEQNKWGVYNNQSEISQHPDVGRLNQAVRLTNQRMSDGQLNTETIPLIDAALNNVVDKDKSKLVQQLSQMVARPDLWRDSQLAFTPFPSPGFNDGMKHFAKDLFDKNLLNIVTPLRKNPSLMQHAHDNHLLGGALQDFIQQKLPFSLSLDEFARQQVSRDITPWFVSSGIVADASEVDASTIQVTFNGVTASLPEWTLNVYRQAGDPFWGQGNFKQDARFESTIGQDLSTLQSNEAAKENLEGYLRRTYLGTPYINQVNSLLDPAHAQQKPFQDLRVAKEISNLRVALEQGKATQCIQNADYQRIDRLLRALPAATSTVDSKERIEYFAIRGKRIPGMYEITLADRSGQSHVPDFQKKFVYMPDAPYGQSLFEKQDLIARLKESPSMRDSLLNRALIKDRTNVDNALSAVKTSSFSANARPIIGGSFTQACDQLIKDKIDNADELTTSRLEMIGEQTWKGAGFALAPVCMMGGPVAVATCALGTAVLTTKDVYDISKKVERGQLDDALWDAALIWADASDIAAGVKPLARGVKGLLRAVGKTHFNTVDEVTDAIKTVKSQQTNFLANGHLHSRLAAVNVNKAVLSKPRQNLPGDFYIQNGKYYVKDGNHMFEVYSDSGWMPDTIRVRDPHNPDAQGPLIQFKDGQWVKNEAGLRGGGKMEEISDDEFELASESMQVTPYTKVELEFMRQETPYPATNNQLGSYDRTNNGKYPFRNELGQPLRIKTMESKSDVPSSGKRYSSSQVKPYVKYNGYEDVGRLYEEKLQLRTFTEADVKVPGEKALVGQSMVVANRRIGKGEIIGVYGGTILPTRLVRPGMDTFYVSIGENVSFKDYSKQSDIVMDGDNIISRINTNFEYDATGKPIKQAATGYNIEQVPFAVWTAYAGDAETPLSVLREKGTLKSYKLHAFFATEDIPAGTELRWDYGYSDDVIKGKFH